MKSYCLHCEKEVEVNDNNEPTFCCDSCRKAYYDDMDYDLEDVD